MNNELYARAGKIANKIKELRDIIHYSEKSIGEIEHGADIRILGNRRNIDISSCNLDDGQEKLMQDMLTTILKIGWKRQRRNWKCCCQRIPLLEA